MSKPIPLHRGDPVAAAARLRQSLATMRADSDLSDLLAAVQTSEVTEKIRTSLAWVLQQLIEAE